MSALLFNTAFAFYVAGLGISTLVFFSNKTALFRIAVITVGVGFGLHSGFLIASAVETARFPLTGLRDSLAFFAWTVSLCFFVSYVRYRIRALSTFLLPAVAALMLGTVFLKASPITPMLRSAWLYVHTPLMFLAYGMFLVTFVAGALYVFQERELKYKKPKTFYYQLPSLTTLDDLFLKFLVAGFCFMTAGLLTGIVWAEQDWVNGWHKDPKVISAMVTWCIYLALIYLRLTAGWRGKRAAVVSMAGFLWVLFTYLGASYFGGLHQF